MCAVRAGGESILGKRAFPTNSARGWSAVTDDILDSISTLMAQLGIKAEDVLAAGVSCGGPLDSRKGVVMCPPNLPDWDNVPITAMITERFGFPAFLQNDANACALAEWRFGAGKGFNNVIFLTFGTGMGAGLVLDGRLYAGTNDYAGEVGHMRLAESGPVGYGKAGSFEGFCSGGGIARFAAEEAKKLLSDGGTTTLCANAEEADTITAKSLAIAAENGDAFAVEMYKKVGERLGQGLAVLVDILNPERIVIGSIFARSEKLIRPSMEKILKREALPGAFDKCEVVPAKLGESIGDYAAVGVAAAGYERMSENE